MAGSTPRSPHCPSRSGAPCSPAVATTSAPPRLSEIRERDAVEGLHHSRSWHRILAISSLAAFLLLPRCTAVVGGGLELASSCHIRVADDTAFFALPEGSRGIFVGGGGSGTHPETDRRPPHARHDADRPRL